MSGHEGVPDGDTGWCAVCPLPLIHPSHQVAKPEPPVVRTEDPWTAHEAANRVEPTRGTRKAAVLNLLRSAGGWVDGAAIASPDVGGSEGLRRLRELREHDGWSIERRPHPTSSTAWQYRLNQSHDAHQRTA